MSTERTVTRDALRETLLAALRNRIEDVVERLVRDGCVSCDALPDVVDSAMQLPAVRAQCEEALDRMLADMRRTAP